MLVKQKNKCSGCGACVASCPVDAIKMKDDFRGFQYPVIDEEKCINCGLCKKVCPFNEKDNSKKNMEESEIFAVKVKDKEIRMKSSSGGMFSVLANYTLENKGVVYGVGFDSDFNVKHLRVKNKEDLNKIRGSKYVQSELGNTFKEIKKDLEKNLLVLFSGTPCQVAGLNSFLRKDYKNLMTVDLICHGVPSKIIWRGFVKSLEKKNKSKLKRFYFRNKERGWREGYNLAIFENGKKLVNDYFLNSYIHLFLYNYSIRESCFNCVFKGYNRVGDFTLGDFWGIEKNHQAFDDNKGVSLVFLNTKKAKNVFEKVKLNLDYVKSNKEEVNQLSLTSPPEAKKDRGQFWKEFNQKGYDFVAKKYSHYGLKNRVKFLVFIKIPGKILKFFGVKRFIKKLLKMK